MSGLDEEGEVITGSERANDRWNGFVWLAMAIMSPAFLIGTHAEFLTRPQQFLVALGFGTTALTLWIVEMRRGGFGQEVTRTERHLGLAFLALMVVVASTAILWDPMGPPAWFVAASLLPSMPCAVGAWRAFR